MSSVRSRSPAPTFSAVYIKASKPLCSICAPITDLQAFLQLVHCGRAVFQRRLRVNVLAYIESVTELIINELSVYAQTFD